MKGLFLICTLIGLVGFTNSLIDKARLAEFKERQQQMKKMIEKMKNDRRSNTDSSSDLFNDDMNVMDQWKEEFEDFLPQALMKKTKDFLEKVKSFIDKKNDDLGIQTEQIEKEWKQTNMLINFYEEQHAEEQQHAEL